MKKVFHIIYERLLAGRSGFTLFFAMLVASLALSVGLAIYDLTVRELDLSATATQSQYAIYAADTGAECALYWDTKHAAFATSSSDTQTLLSGVLCNGQDIAATAVTAHTWPVAADANDAATTFTMTLSPQPYCATVTVIKTGNPPSTTILSDGFNTCSSSGGLQLERALEVNY